MTIKKIYKIRYKGIYYKKRKIGYIDKCGYVFFYKPRKVNWIYKILGIRVDYDFE